MSSAYEKEKLLSSREYDVLRLAAHGKTNAGIGAMLHIAETTVEGYLTSIYAKLGVADTAQFNRRVLAVVLGIKYQIIPVTEIANVTECLEVLQSFDEA